MVDIEKIEKMKIEISETAIKFDSKLDKIRERRNIEIEARTKLIYDECYKIFSENEDLTKEVYGLIKYADTSESKVYSIKDLKKEMINIICKNSKRVILIEDFLLRAYGNRYNPTTISIGVNLKGFGYCPSYREKLDNDFDYFTRKYIDDTNYSTKVYLCEDLDKLKELCIAVFTKFAKEKGVSEELIAKIPLIFEKNKKIEEDSFKIEIGLEGDNKLVLDRLYLYLRDVAENKQTKKEIRFQDEFSTSREVNYYLELNFFSQYKEKIIEGIRKKRAEMEIKNAEIERIYLELENILMPYRVLKQI
jgi:hypothetical protein